MLCVQARYCFLSAVLSHTLGPIYQARLDIRSRASGADRVGGGGEYCKIHEVDHGYTNGSSDSCQKQKKSPIIGELYVKPVSSTSEFHCAVL